MQWLQHYPCCATPFVSELIQQGFFRTYQHDVRILQYKKLNPGDKSFSYNPIINVHGKRLLDIVEVRRIHHGNPKLKGQYGLFAKKRIPKDTPLGVYIGHLYGVDEYAGKSVDLMEIQMKSQRIVIEPDADKMILRNINDPRLSNSNKRLYYTNVAYSNTTINNIPCMILYTVQNISVGSELYMAYGDSYWEVIKS